ncbi:MAG: NF038132 family protein [Gammaproteobacteria bacterium]
MKRAIGLFLLAASAAMDASAVTVVGNAGSLGANGVVTLPPNGDTSYGWVSTYGGAPGGGLPYIVPGINGGIGNTNGSILRSDPFSANAGEDLQFWFNYVTSDGAGFADYGWARLLDASYNEVALLFTARTKPSGSIVPGFGMPTPLATLLPVAVPIISGAPAWAPLGISSTTCFGTGCGYTGWVQANYSITSAGTYSVEYGATNWSDSYFDSGLAFSGLTIEGAPINTQVVPVPAAAWLFGSGLTVLACAFRRRSMAA